MTVNGHQKNMKGSCTKHLKLGITSIGIEKLVRQPKGTMQSSIAAWKNGSTGRESRLYRPSSYSIWSTSKGDFIHANSSTGPRCSPQNDPSKAPGSQPVFKNPPTTGRGRPAGFYSADEPPRIGTAPVQPPPPPKPVSPLDAQPPGLFQPPAPTPMTPGNPPRPPVEALPKPMPAGTSQATHKHPLPQPAQQGPPNKQVRHKARQSAPSPKGPPESFMPTPGDIQHMSSSLAAVDQGDQSERRRHYRVRSASDIDWNYPLEGQLEPNLKGGPSESK